RLERRQRRIAHHTTGHYRQHDDVPTRPHPISTTRTCREILASDAMRGKSLQVTGLRAAHSANPSVRRATPSRCASRAVAASQAAELGLATGEVPAGKNVASDAIRTA